MTVNFDDIPDDVLLGLFATCAIGDRQRVRVTCRRLKTLHDDSDTLQYELELAAAGLKESPPLVPEAVFRPPSSVSRTGNIMVCHTGAPHTFVYYPKKVENEDWAPWQKHRSDITVPALPVPGRGALSIKEKRERLRDRGERWLLILPAVTRTLRFDGTFNPNWMVFNGGVMLQSTGYQGQPERPTTVFPSMMIPFPSATNPDLHTPYLAGKRWQMVDPDKLTPLNARNRCAMDPSQDLLVIPIFQAGWVLPITDLNNGNTLQSNFPPRYLLTIKSMTTHAQHPRAAKAQLTWQLPPPLTILGGVVGLTCDLTNVQVFGTTVAAKIVFSKRGNDFCVPVIYMWNWVTGELFGEIVGHRSRTHAENFELLSERTVLVCSGNWFVRDKETVPMCFDIWTIPENEPLGDKLPGLPEQGKRPHPGVCIVHLDMPRLKQQCYEIWISPLRQGAATRAVGGSPFVPDDQRGLIRVSFWARNQYNIYFLRETMLEMARAGEERVRGPLRVRITTATLNALYNDHDLALCNVPGCACTWTFGGFRPGAPADPWKGEDERGRAFSSTHDNPVLRRYEWSAWGPEIARMTYTNEGPNTGHARILRKYATAAYRDVLFHIDGGYVAIEVRDFSPALVAKVTAGNLPELPPDVEVTVSAFGELVADHVWVDDVFTSLPYVAITRRLHRIPFIPQSGSHDVLALVAADEQRLCYGAIQRLEGVDGAGCAVYKTELMVLCM